MTTTAILGGGPAGVGAARRLRELDRSDVVLFEQGDRVGGNAGSFERNGHVLDYGSHRLHPASDAEVLEDVRALLGDELLDRPRHGRIRLLGRWVHFPLKPGDLMLRLDKRFAAGVMGDMVKRTFGGKKEVEDTFSSVLRANLGGTICDHFYFPYARKIWGLAPEAMSGVQARRRVSAGSFGKLLKKVAGQLPGIKRQGTGRFFYPRRGFGQITEAYAEAAEKDGARILTGHRVTEMIHEDPGWTLKWESANGAGAERVDRLWSTIPLTILVRLAGERAPAEVVEAARGIDYRSMILVYLELDVDQFTEFDAHYFPGEDLTITRLSEPKNYAARTEPRGRTVLCAELPCERDGAVWNESDEELGRRVVRDLETSELPLVRPPVDVWTARLPHAYPIYQRGYEEALGTLRDWASSLPDFLSFGRQGLFAHDNTHHALFMAYSAADCVRDGVFDEAAWAEYLKIFATHVVED